MVAGCVTQKQAMAEKSDDELDLDIFAHLFFGNKSYPCQAMARIEEADG